MSRLSPNINNSNKGSNNSNNSSIGFSKIEGEEMEIIYICSRVLVTNCLELRRWRCRFWMRRKISMRWVSKSSLRTLYWTRNPETTTARRKKKNLSQRQTPRWRWKSPKNLLFSSRVIPQHQNPKGRKTTNTNNFARVNKTEKGISSLIWQAGMTSNSWNHSLKYHISVEY